MALEYHMTEFDRSLNLWRDGRKPESWSDLLRGVTRDGILTKLQSENLKHMLESGKFVESTTFRHEILYTMHILTNLGSYVP